jgi:hypothetical protein
MFVMKKATEEDRVILENMYGREVENNTERVEAFAGNPIDSFNTIVALKDGKLCETLTWSTRGRYDNGVVELITLGVSKKFQRQ